jgi:hypothetical protein
MQAFPTSNDRRILILSIWPASGQRIATTSKD